MFVIQTEMQFWESGPWQEQWACVWQVFPVELTVDWWWAVASLIGNPDGADCSQGFCAWINEKGPYLKASQTETNYCQNNDIK